MSRIEKLIRRFKSKPKDFTWGELERLLYNLGYQQIQAGKTSGSRVKFIHDHHPPIFLHKPHPTPVLKAYQMNAVLEMLQMEGLL